MLRNHPCLKTLPVASVRVSRQQHVSVKMSAFAIYQELKVDALKRNIVNYLQQLCAIEGTEEHQIYKSDVQRVDFNYAAELCFEDLVMLTRNQQFKS